MGIKQMKKIDAHDLLKSMKSMMIAGFGKSLKKSVSENGDGDEDNDEVMLNNAEDKNNEHGFMANNDDDQDAESESRPSVSFFTNLISG